MKFEIIEDFGYYDGPVIFLCRDSVGQKYFAMWHSEDDNGRCYLYAPISDERQQDILANKISLRDVFTCVEGRMVLFMRGDCSVIRIPSNILTDNDLPNEYIYLKETNS